MPTGPGSLLLDVAEQIGDVETAMSTVAASLRAWVGAGPVFLATADPFTGEFAATFTFDIPVEAAVAFFQIEMAGSDICRFDALPDAGGGVAALSTATDGHLEMSERWREVMSPLHWGDEMRAVVRANGHTWGYLCLHREGAERAFLPRDQARLAAMLPAMATALRAVATAAPANPGQLDTGVILADCDGRVIDVTDAAADWLAELGPALPGGLPLLLDGLCRRVIAGGEAVSALVQTRLGRSALIEAAPLPRANAPVVALVIRTPPAVDSFRRFATGAGLTAREQDVVECVMRGLSTREIAEELAISTYTVQAHLTAVFGKTGLGSRRELTSRLRLA